MEKSQVAIVKGERGHNPVFEALNLLDYQTALKSYNRALIKVNFISTQTWDTGATTDPIVVEAIILALKRLPIEIIVVESDATITNADKAFEATGMAEMCKRNDIEYLNLRYLGDRTKIEIPNGDVLKNITVPRIVKESAIISAAKLKTHMSTKVTLGMKNMFGLLPDKLKFRYHTKGISKVIVDINTAIKPTLTVIDGFIAMEGRGPTDATASRIMSIDPNEISHIKRAHEKGIGNLNSENIEIKGTKIEDVKRVFKRY
jgi:uncharacterized protein (DUF362 family)